MTIGKGKIITVGINPAWDINCMIDGIDWGDHKIIDEQISTPAGKALNVSKSLAYLGYMSVAAGLWGEHDYDDMVAKLRPLSGFLDLSFTVANGRTRRNVCISDTHNHRQMHLRLSGTLASRTNIKKLADQVLKLVDKDDVCIFAGSIPEGNFSDDIVSLFWDCRQKEAMIILDSSGSMFNRLVETGQVSVIAPNTQELEELIDSNVKEEPSAIARAGKKLLDKVDMILVSMGALGSVLVNKEGYWHTELVGVPMPVKKTVGCGDNLLGGFVSGLHEDSDPGYALEKAVRIATGFAYGLCDTHEFWELEEKVHTETSFYKF
ncbi:MAG: 1-phosphofructokinase family hexose kinase [Sedimentisphaeraceae bacterium JB056]